jgi:hypothetical protein
VSADADHEGIVRLVKDRISGAAEQLPVLLA